jgi:hypothetical protein
MGRNFLKASSVTSEQEKIQPSALQDQTAANVRLASPHSPPADGGYPLGGPSDLPDPTTHAYRTDLADVALAGRVIASHYAEPLQRAMIAAAPLFAAPDDREEPLVQLLAGDLIRVLDISRGWAWGYAPGGQVGYVRAAAITG